MREVKVERTCTHTPSKSANQSIHAWWIKSNARRRFFSLSGEARHRGIIASRSAFRSRNLPTTRRQQQQLGHPAAQPSTRTHQVDGDGEQQAKGGPFFSSPTRAGLLETLGIIVTVITAQKRIPFCGHHLLPIHGPRFRPNRGSSKKKHWQRRRSLVPAVPARPPADMECSGLTPLAFNQSIRCPPMHRQTLLSPSRRASARNHVREVAPA